MLKVADLFAGVGGIALAFKNNGFDISWANEIDKNACLTYKKNFSHKLIQDDIKNLDFNKLDDIDIITAGFPCQPFSIAGKQKGFKDERGNLFFEILRAIDIKNPKIVFLENVKNLLNHNKGQTFLRIKKELEDRNYYIKYQILNTCEYSQIPQNRERIYILAFKDKNIYNNFFFPNKTNKLKNINDLLEEEVENKYYYNNYKIYDKIKDIVKKNKFYQWRRVYLRENKNDLCPTLTANMGTGGHNVPIIRDNKDIRKLTPRECFRFQGFPNSFILPKELSNSYLYKQAGNSVSVPVIDKIVKNLKNAILNIENNEFINNDLYDFYDNNKNKKIV